METELNSSYSKSSISGWAEQYSTSGAIATIVAVTFIILVIIFGNALTIVAVLTQPKLQQLQNWFIVSLAVADLLVGLLIMPLSLSYEVLGSWKVGWLLCELWLALDVLFVTSSILNLCMISLDRYWSVTRAVEYRQKRTPRLVLLLIASAWILAVTISFPPLLGWRPDRADYVTCDVSDQLDYVLYSSFGSFFIPSVFILILYTRIFKFTRERTQKLIRTRSLNSQKSNVSSALEATEVNAKQQINGQISFEQYISTVFSSIRRQNNKGINGVEPSTSTNVASKSTTLKSLADASSVCRNLSIVLTKDNSQQILSDLESCSPEQRPSPVLVRFGSVEQKETMFADEARSQRASKTSRNESSPLLNQRQKRLHRREIRATAILGCILFAFIASWLPFFMLYVLAAINGNLRAPETVFDVFFWLGYCNSAFNPIIYAFVNVDFRRAFKRILRIRDSAKKWTRV